MNALYPERFDKDDAKELEELLDRAEDGARLAVRAAVSEHRRAKSQRDQLKRLKSRVSAPVSNLPFVFKPKLEVSDLELLSESI